MTCLVQDGIRLKRAHRFHVAQPHADIQLSWKTVWTPQEVAAVCKNEKYSHLLNHWKGYFGQYSLIRQAHYDGLLVMQGSLGVYLQLVRKRTKMCTYQNKQTNSFSANRWHSWLKYSSYLLDILIFRKLATKDPSCHNLAHSCFLSNGVLSMAETVLVTKSWWEKFLIRKLTLCEIHPSLCQLNTEHTRHL